MEQRLRGLHHPQTEADMARSTLDPGNFPAGRKPRQLKGHDTKSLGPSDSSDRRPRR
jgi:hypothetical protein